MYIVVVNNVSKVGSEYGTNAPDFALMTEDLSEAQKMAHKIAEHITKTDSSAHLDKEYDGHDLIPETESIGDSIDIFWDKPENWDNYSEIAIVEMQPGKNYYKPLLQNNSKKGKTKTFYHLTQNKNLGNIRYNGLIPQLGTLANIKGETVPGIWLFPSREAVNDALLNWYWEEMENIATSGIALLEVTVPEDFPIEPSEAEYECVTRNLIPPEYISVISYDL